ncbi:MAG: TonB-dependent receptor [Pseudomonadota bacterium]
MLQLQWTQNFRECCFPAIIIISTAITFISPVWAESPSNPTQASRLETVVVTGTRLKQVDLEGPLPLVLITRQQIEQSGEISVAALLRDQIDNNLGSYTPTSGTGVMQGAAQVNLRGLGPGRTLVLIDGRRMPNNPANGGASQNINNIPLALVERIEILRGGASAIYGSDAIGGVINIITRKDYNGMQLGGQLDFPDGGVGNAQTASLLGGFSNDKGNLFFSLEHYNKEIIYSRDRDGVRSLTSGNGYPGTINEYDAAGNFLDSRPFSDCPTAGFGSSPEYPNSTVIDDSCRYLLGGETALTAAVKRDSLSVGGNYRLPAGITLFTRATLLSAKTVGHLSPASVDTIIDGVKPGVASGNVGVLIRPDSPFYPEPGDPNYRNPDSTLVLNYRISALGLRDTVVNEQVGQFLLGLSGRLNVAGFNDWEIAASYNNYQQDAFGKNNGLRREFQTAVDGGRFNPFAPDAQAADEFRYTTTNDNRFSSEGIDGKIHLDLKSGDINIPMVYGAEFRHDQLAVIGDAQSAQNVLFSADGSIKGFNPSNVFGYASGTAEGTRSYMAAYTEAATQLFEDKLDLGLALRYDHYNDVGGSFSPKLSLGYRPLKSLLLRTHLSRGFRAPDLGSMYGAPSKGSGAVFDSLGCRDNPANTVACSSNRYAVVMDSNPQLEPEKSKSASAGLVWNATSKLSLTADYYAVTIDNAITQLAPQTVFDNELRCDEQGRQCDARREGYVLRDASKMITFAYLPAINAAIMKTSGLNLGARYNFQTQRFGSYSLGTELARMLSYQRKDSAIAPMLERLDSLNGASEIFPKLRANANLNWAQGRFKSALVLNYIGDVTDCDVPDKIAGKPACKNKFGDYLTADLQLSVNTPWRQNFAMGARNLFNQKPQVSQYLKSSNNPGIFYGLHNSDQRVIYLRMTQDF